MGTYTDLCVADYSLFSTKSAVDPALMTVFRERDRRVVEPHEPDDTSVEAEKPDDGESQPQWRTVTYLCRVWEAAARLDVMGFTLARAREEFTRLNEKEADSLLSLSKESEPGSTWRRREAFQRWLSFEDYGRVLATIIAERPERHYFDHFDPAEGEFSDAMLRTYSRSRDGSRHRSPRRGRGSPPRSARR